MADLKRIPGLTRKIGVTRFHLGVLRGVEAFWPVLLLVSLFVLIALTGLFDRTSEATAALAALITGLGGLFLLWRGWRKYKLPEELEARNALDRGSELRPISSLTDRPADITEDGQTLWSAHMMRLARAARALRLPRFGADWHKADPLFLRAVLPAALLLGVITAGSEGSGRLLRALSPDYGTLVGADDVRVEAWITPPDYTRRAPIFLPIGELDAVRVPAGSEITVRAQARSAPKLRLKGDQDRRSERFEATPDGAYEIKAKITEDSEVTVNWWGKRAGWTFQASPDALPTAEFVILPAIGANDQTDFTWKVADDYGVTQLEFAMRLIEPHPAVPDEERRVPIELPGLSLKEAEEKAALNMTRHPWAGLMVEARLVATDAGGQEGYSAPHEFVLPEKLFLQTLARATQEVRVTVLREPRDYLDEPVAPQNRLEIAPDGIKRADLMLEAITYEPYRFFGQYEFFLGLSTARNKLKAATSLEQAYTTDDLLWAIALKAEYGSAADALAALLAAKKALERALRDGASEAEIARLTEAFRQAAENYVQAKLAEAIANGLPDSAQEDGLDNQQAGGSGPSLGQNSFEDMLNALEDLTETGATDQARQLLSDITNMLENLEFQQGNGSGGDGFALPNQGGEQGEDGEQDAETQELAEQLEDLSDALREQRELNDDTLEAQRGERSQQRAARNQQQQGQQQGQPGQSGQPQGGEPGEGGEGGLTREELAERQAAIGELIEQLALGGPGEEDGEASGGGEGEDPNSDARGGLGGEELEDILRAQERAEDALRNGQFSRAQRNQALVTQGLQELAGQLVSELDQLRGEDQNQETQLDPFGNPIGGPGSSDEVDVPEQSERQRALDILQELRRRYDEATDPEEREYLERLLDRF